jgi:mRNA interferase MazF
MADHPELQPGAVVWALLSPVVGSEQQRHRPAVVVSSAGYLSSVTPRIGLVIVVPATTVEHGWRHHVPMTGPTGLDRPSWALTDQPRTVSTNRISGVAGRVDDTTAAAIGRALRLFLHLP